MVYKTSTDGIIWAGPTTIGAGYIGRYFSVWFDETLSYLHYARSEAWRILYRRGIPNSDGSITWSEAEQTAVPAVADTYFYDPFVSVDSNGYPWIGYTRIDGTGRYPFAIRSANNVPPIWSGAEGADQLSTVSAFRAVSVIPLTGGEMLAVYGRENAGTKVNARRWNGAIWETEISTSNPLYGYYRYSAVAQGDDVHLVFLRGTDVYSDIRLTYAKYDYSSNSFIDEKFLTEHPAPPVISIDDNNNLLVFWGGWPEMYTVYYMIYTAENDTWGPAVKWSSENILHLDTLTCFYKQYSGYTGLAYTLLHPSPYEVKLNYIAPPPTPGVEAEPEEPGSPGAPDPTPEPEVVSNTLTVNGSRHTTPEEGSIGTSLRTKRGRIIRHLTWVPVVITRA